MIKTLSALICAILPAGPALAEDQAGVFDYYVLALSWSPSWCKLESDGGSEQCAAGSNRGFVLHGLWPQYEEGWPEFCRTSHRDPSRRMTRDMADIMGSSGLAWHQWKKHGRCSGLSAAEYYQASRAAFEAVTRPEVLRKIDRTFNVPPLVIEEAFLDSNPDMTADGVTVTCRQNHLREVRICLTRDLEPRDCTGRTIRDCRDRSIAILPVR